MSHDRGCFFCGKEKFEQKECTNFDCPKKREQKPDYRKKIAALAEEFITTTYTEISHDGYLSWQQYYERKITALFEEILRDGKKEVDKKSNSSHNSP